MTTIYTLVSGHPLWISLAEYARNCSWRAGANLANMMEQNRFTHEEECVFAAEVNGSIAGFCALVKKDCIPDVLYTPYVSFVFVGDEYRGKRLSEQLIDHAAAYAKSFGYDRIYLVSDHVGLYEKYGFTEIDRKPAPWNDKMIETIFVRGL